MYSIAPSRTFVSDRVLKHAEARKRFERFLAGARRSDYEVVEDERIPWMVQQPEWRRCAGRVGERGPIEEPVFFFNTFRFDGLYAERIKAASAAYPHIDPKRFAQKHLWGYRHIKWFNSSQAARDVKPCPDHVCRPCWRLTFSPGCVHRCWYCGLEGGMTVGLNIGDYLAELDAVIAETPWQLTYLGDDSSDLLILEPELGLVRDVSEDFGRRTDPDRYFIIHTKSANVDFLRDVDHRGHTIPCWSLSGHTQSTVMEALSGSMAERVEAAAKCQDWGMPVRFKFKPFIPVRNWRDEARAMLRHMFERTRPDNLSMTVLMWMTFKELESCVDLALLDAEFVDAARRHARANGDAFSKTGPFPPEMRCKVYTFLLHEVRAIDPGVPLTVSTESLDVWKVMGPLLGVAPGEYVCGCGPCAVPGLKRLAHNAWAVARQGLPLRVQEEA